MYPLPLEDFTCLEVWPLGHDGSILLSVVAQALLCNFLCPGSSSSLILAKPLMAVSGKSKLLCAGFRTEAHRRRRVAEGGLPLQGKVNALDRWAKCFRKHVLSLKNLLLLILVIFKLKCNNLIINETIVLNASYVCLQAYSLRQESPDPDPGRWTPHFWGGSITAMHTRRALSPVRHPTRPRCSSSPCGTQNGAPFHFPPTTIVVHLGSLLSHYYAIEKTTPMSETSVHESPVTSRAHRLP
jgi:hypothetical protein